MVMGIQHRYPSVHNFRAHSFFNVLYALNIQQREVHTTVSWLGDSLPPDMVVMGVRTFNGNSYTFYQHVLPPTSPPYIHCKYIMCPMNSYLILNSNGIYLHVH